MFSLPYKTKKLARVHQFSEAPVVTECTVLILPGSTPAKLSTLLLLYLIVVYYLTFVIGRLCAVTKHVEQLKNISSVLFTLRVESTRLEVTI
jgi:hypothetical protein